jgi:hypothetical protein
MQCILELCHEVHEDVGRSCFAATSLQIRYGLHLQRIVEITSFVISVNRADTATQVKRSHNTPVETLREKRYSSYSFMT